MGPILKVKEKNIQVFKQSYVGAFDDVSKEKGLPAKPTDGFRSRFRF